MAINVKKLLAESLLELSEEKPLDKISVTDIVKRAGAGRQTFYNHFKDKNDLLYWIYKRTLVGEKETIQNEGFYAAFIEMRRKSTVIFSKKHVN